MTSIPNFIEEARRKVAELERKQAQVGERWNAVQEEWNRVDAERRRYQSFIDVWFELNPQGEGTVASETAFVARLHEMTIADGVELVLEERASGTLPLAEIIRWLRQAGKLSGDNKFASSSVIKTMQRYPDRFYNVSRGIWGLVKYRKSEQRTLTAPGAEGTSSELRVLS